MSPYQRKQQDKQRKNFYRKWHRRMGFTGAIFFFSVAITGILLNHSDDLDLQKRFITSDWIVEWYGIKAPDSAACLSEISMSQQLCQIAEKIYYGNNLLIEESNTLVGLVKEQELIYVATTNAIYVFTEEMALVDVLDKNSKLPTPISNIQRLGDSNQGAEVSISVKSNGHIYRLDQTDMLWKKFSSEKIAYFVVKELNKRSERDLPEDKLNKLKNLYLDRQITQLKFIQDLHSLRIFSTAGKLLSDLSAIVIILLSVSGFIAWRRRKEKSNLS